MPASVTAARPQHLLVTLTGKDRPGVTSALFDALAPYDADVLDIEQVVIHGRLVLGVLLEVRRNAATVRAVLNGERIAYWLSVGALPSERCAVLIKKYGVGGTHLEQQKAALEKIKTHRPQAPAPYIPPPKPPEPEPVAEAPAEAAPAAEAEQPAESAG